MPTQAPYIDMNQPTGAYKKNPFGVSDGAVTEYASTGNPDLERGNSLLQGTGGRVVAGAASLGASELMGGGMNPFGNLQDMLTAPNPNATKEGQDLQAQKGATVSWGGTALGAHALLGDQVGAPQIGSTAPVVVGTDANGQSVYGPSGATVSAPNWQQAQVAAAQAAQAGFAPQAVGATMQGAQLNDAQANQTRQAQNQLASSLQGTAAGQGPSIAQSQLQQATAANVNQQAAQAQALHGSARLAALRQAQMTGAATQQTAAAQAAGLRAQEIGTAQANLGNVLGTQRGQDIGLSAQNAQLAQQTGLANSGYQQQANMLNPQLSQQTNMLNANLLQGANQFNAGSQNTSNLNYAGQQNQGNLAISQANLGAQQGTNQLNTTRAIADINAQQAAAAGQTGINTTAMAATQQSDKDKQGITGGLLNGAGGALVSALL